MITRATLETNDFIISLFSSDAVISRKTSSSAPSLLYFSANETGSPASLIDLKCRPLTTLPFATSRQGMTLTKRIIPCLDIANGRVVKGLNF